MSIGSFFSGFWRRGVLAVVVMASVAMLATSFEVQARRLGGGLSIGRQSTKAMTAPRSHSATPQNMATPPKSAAPAAATPAAAGRTGAAGTRSGLSRWLGPIAGIAAGLGLAALLSHLGLSAALAEWVSVLLLVLLVVAGLSFIVRRLRGKTLQTGTQGGYGQVAHASPTYRQSAEDYTEAVSRPASTSSVGTTRSARSSEARAETASVSSDSAVMGEVPADFDVPRFLEQAKAQFIRIQAIWDSGDLVKLREYLTDDLIVELTPKLAQRQAMSHHTEVVLLNAELLGIETVPEGNLASVRFSGMLREDVDTEAVHFEEIWNLIKPAQQGWLLAGIQQISDSSDAS